MRAKRAMTFPSVSEEGSKQMQGQASCWAVDPVDPRSTTVSNCWLRKSLNLSIRPAGSPAAPLQTFIYILVGNMSSFVESTDKLRLRERERERELRTRHGMGFHCHGAWSDSEAKRRIQLLPTLHFSLRARFRVQGFSTRPDALGRNVT